MFVSAMEHLQARTAPKQSNNLLSSVFKATKIREQTSTSTLQPSFRGIQGACATRRCQWAADTSFRGTLHSTRLQPTCLMTLLTHTLALQLG